MKGRVKKGFSLKEGGSWGFLYIYICSGLAGCKRKNERVKKNERETEKRFGERRCSTRRRKKRGDLAAAASSNPLIITLTRRLAAVLSLSCSFFRYPCSLSLGNTGE